MGPNLLWHIGGGEGGIQQFMEKFMDPLATLMKNLGNPDVTPDLKQTITGCVMREAGNRFVRELAKEENEMLLDLINLRTKATSESTSAKKGKQM
jgi:hypothetical protein